MPPAEPVLRKWLHSRHFSILGYLAGLIVGSYIGLAGFVFVMQMEKDNVISASILELPIVAVQFYLSILDYLVVALPLSSLVMAPVTYGLLVWSRNWTLRNFWKFSILGVPVAALFALGQVIFALDELGGAFVEAPVNTLVAIVLGGAAGGLVYLGVTALTGISLLRADTAT